MMNASNAETLIKAVQRYFDLMYEADISQFERVFAPTAQLHGLKRGKVVMLPAQAYKDAMAGAPSPRSLEALREEQVLLMDFASPNQALVKVRVRINTTVYVDYLAFHFIDGDWLITAKSFHIESAA